MKLNIGCGYDKRDGWTNVDSVSDCQPDVLHNAEQTPWPWPDSSVDMIEFCHSLEHMGQQPTVFFAIIKEVWRVCKPGATVIVVAPYPRHESFIQDPTHVRAIVPETFMFFSRKCCDEWRQKGMSNSHLAYVLGVDFDIVETHGRFDQGYKDREKEASQWMRTWNNVLVDTTTVLKVVK